MTDDQLKEFIPKYGDRVALRSYLSRKRKQPKRAEKMSLLEKLRLKIKRKHEDTNSNDDEPSPSTSAISTSPQIKNALKQNRQVEIGLMLFDDKKQTYIQVRSRKGGGVRVMKLSKLSTKADIIAKAKEVFFNGETFGFGNENEYEFDLMDFQEVILDEGISVNKILDVTKVQKLRFYLALRKKPTLEHIQEIDPVVSSVNLPLNVLDTDAPNALVSAALQSGAYSITDTVAPTVIDEYQGFNNIVYEDSMGEVQFLAQESNYFGVNNYAIVGTEFRTVQPAHELNDATVADMEPEQLVKLHRGHIFKELREVFGKPINVKNLNLKIELFLPNGQKEVAEDNGGVMRDALSEFWTSFYEQCTIGHDVKIPLLRHDFNQVDWSAIAKVFAFGWIHHRYFPIKLSKVFMSYSIYGVDTFATSEDTLIQEFTSFVSTSEKQTIQNALTGEFDSDEAVDLLSAYDCKVLPSKDNFKRVVSEIAHKTLIQEPSFIKDVWYDTIKEQMFLIDEDVFNIYNKLIPSARKVVEILRFPDSMSSAEQETSKHLKKFIRGLDNEKLQLFLRFCTGSDVLGIDSSLQFHVIQVRFTSLTGIARRPVAHTCGRVLELPVQYEDYMQFKSEFCEILKSDVWVMDFV